MKKPSRLEFGGAGNRAQRDFANKLLKAEWKKKVAGRGMRSPAFAALSGTAAADSGSLVTIE